MKQLLAVASFVLLASVFTGGCKGEPESVCNRVRFSWPNLQIDPGLNPGIDVSPQEGVQLNFSVESDLGPGVLAALYLEVGAGPGRDLVGEAVADQDGRLSFQEVSVPEGNITFIIESSDSCGIHQTGRRTFVWDGLGVPTCELSLGLPAIYLEDVAIPVLGLLSDEDSSLPGLQVRVLIDAGRPDMQIQLFLRDREQEVSREFSGISDASGQVEFALTLEQGEQAMRGSCYWESEDFRQSTATHVFQVLRLGPPTYQNFAQPFFAKYCTTCHSPSAVTSFVPYLNTYERVRALAPRIDVRAGISTSMPPFDPRLSLDERTELSAWIASGAERQ